MICGSLPWLNSMSCVHFLCECSYSVSTTTSTTQLIISDSSCVVRVVQQFWDFEVAHLAEGDSTNRRVRIICFSVVLFPGLQEVREMKEEAGNLTAVNRAICFSCSLALNRPNWPSNLWFAVCIIFTMWTQTPIKQHSPTFRKGQAHRAKGKWSRFTLSDKCN